MLTHLRDFLSTGVKTLVAGTEKLHILFATYNTVGGYKNGNIQTDKQGLTIQVQNGNLEYSPITMAALMGPSIEVMGIGHDMMFSEGRRAQSELEAKLKIDSEGNAPLLAVIYAGLSAFDESVAMARKIKREQPTAKIVITTCNCSLNRKEQTLIPMLMEREIDYAVVTGECGGDYMMRQILEQATEIWPVKVSSVQSRGL